MSWLNDQTDEEPRRLYGPAADEMPESARTLVLPALLGVVVAVVVYLLLFAIILVVTLASFDYTKDFDSADAVKVAVAGAIGLGLACGLGAWLCGRRARLRVVPAGWVHRVALATGLGFGVLMVVLGLALAVRPITLPIYAVGLITGSVLGARLGARR